MVDVTDSGAASRDQGRSRPPKQSVGPRQHPGGGVHALTRPLRAGFGIVLLVAPGPVARLAAGRRPRSRAIVFTRVLGARHLAQAALLGGGGRRARLAGAGIDAMHAASALHWARGATARRRALLLNALVAGAFALEGVRPAQAGAVSSPSD